MAAGEFVSEPEVPYSPGDTWSTLSAFGLSVSVGFPTVAYNSPAPASLLLLTGWLARPGVSQSEPFLAGGAGVSQF